MASDETGWRKTPAETLIHIARLYSKWLDFFAPNGQAQIANPAAAHLARNDALPSEALTLQSVTNALRLRPAAIPLVIAFLEAVERPGRARRS
ncbi:MAG: hypothetical protein RMJ54_15005 [Roseiflexaceae bacterium]|nr:hypothetical protein [Roseiflexaceae bacterium]